MFYNESSGGSGEIKPVIHKNSHDYVGETHVYRLKDPVTGETHKIGESARGYRKSDGASKRAEEQARKLRKETGVKYDTEVRKKFETKKDAYQYEGKAIEKFRGIYGEDKLPGNKGKH